MKTYHVPFITVEDGDDLIVSFPLDEYATESLTLLRTPKYDSLLPEEERGVSVELGDADEFAEQLLVVAEWGVNTVKIATSVRSYSLNVVAVSAAEIREAKRVLQKMNFDRCFELKNV
jgi:hypothetical protein